LAITITWGTKVINVPQADLTFLGGLEYELDVDVFRLALKGLEDTEDGIAFIRTHNHNPPVTVGGIVLGRVVEIINGYTVTFEDPGSSYSVTLVGANNNVQDVSNLNRVSIRSTNSAGLQIVTQGSGLDAGQDARLTRIEQIIRNRRTLDQADGKLKVSNDASGAVLLEAPAWEDAAGTQPYRGTGVERTDRLETP